MIDFAVYCDGSCRSGRMGAGVKAVCIPTAIAIERSYILGEGINNLAEILAIQRGLRLIKPGLRARASVTVYSDSEYAIGVLTKGIYIPDAQNQ